MVSNRCSASNSKLTPRGRRNGTTESRARAAKMRLPACPPRLLPLRDGQDLSGRGGSLAADALRPPERRSVMFMLQDVHVNPRTPQASSLYCQWICVEREGKKQVVAVWIDLTMSAFEKEFAAAEPAVGSAGKTGSKGKGQSRIEKRAKRVSREPKGVRTVTDGEGRESEDRPVASNLHIEGTASTP